MKAKFIQMVSQAERDSKTAKAFRERLAKAGLVSSGWFWSCQSPNGKFREVTVKDVWDRYQMDHLSTISESARELKLYRCRQFLPPLFGLRMCELNPQVISELVRYSKEIESLKTLRRRFSFEKELRDLRSILNWFRETVDFQFINPFNQTHYKLAVIKEKPVVQRQITLDELQRFLKELPPFWRDLATVQFYCGGRIGEIAGLQWKNVNFEAKTVTIQEIIVWIRGQARIKATPKMGVTRQTFLNDSMLEIFNRQLLLRSDAPFVFHRKGKPLRYSVIAANVRPNFVPPAARV